MSLQDDFNKLKTSIIGTKTAELDQKLDLAVKDILSYKSNSGRLGYIDLMKNFISKTANSSISKITGSSNLFSQVSTPSAFGQGQRLSRYKMYESIVSYIGYCMRALNVLIDNVLSPDDITKDTLDVNAKKFLEDTMGTMTDISYVKDLISILKIEKYLPMIVRGTLQQGDFFVEIANQKNALLSRSFLAESNYKNLQESFVNLHHDDKIHNDTLDLKYTNENKQEFSLKIKMDYTCLYEESSVVSMLKDDSKENNDSKDKKLLKNCTLVLHDPSRVVKLQSELYPICFGYLVFPKYSIAPGLSVQDQAVNDICRNIINSLSSKIPQIEDMNKSDEIKEIVSDIIKQSSQEMSLTIRYISPDRMQHFFKPSTKNYPYGESIFYGTEFNSKVLISLETALAVQRINRSTEKRKIAIEIGLPRDAQKMIQKLKEQFRKRKITLDSYGSVDTIPSTIGSFEDIYIPQKDGKPFVDITTMTEGNIDIRSKVDELKFLRDSIVASLNVPPSFIGIEENLSNKSALSEENIIFARCVVNNQKFLSEQVTELINKIIWLVDPDKATYILENVSINFPSPKSLQFERESRYTSDLANLVETLERIGIPKEYSIKKYLTSIDWNELENYKINSKIDNILQPPNPQDQFGGGMMPPPPMPTMWKIIKG